MHTSLQHLKEDKHALLAELQAAGAEIHDPQNFRCPFHDDKNPSAGIYTGRDDRTWRFKCHGGACGFGGTIVDVRARRLNIPAAEALAQLDPDRGGSTAAATATRAPNSAENRQTGSEPPHPPPQPAKTAQKPRERKIWPSRDQIRDWWIGKLSEDLGVPVRCAGQWRYLAADGRTVLLVVWRFDWASGKTYRQAHPVGGGWRNGKPPDPWPLANLPSLARCQTVLIVEGEKCAIAPYRLDKHFTARTGVATTCIPFGSGEWHKGEDGHRYFESKCRFVDLTPLAGKKLVFWPDADEGGMEHARQMAQRCLDTLDPPPRGVSVIEPAELGLGPGEDVADFLADDSLFDTAESRISGLMDAMKMAAKPMGPDAELEQMLEQRMDGRWAAYGWPWPHMDRLCKVLWPESVTLISGTENSGKTPFLMEAALYWHDEGIPFSVLHLEKSRKWHMNRALAQYIGDTLVLADQATIGAQVGKLRGYMEEARPWAVSFGRHIHTWERDKSAEKVCRWVLERAKAGDKIIAIDNLGSIDRGDKVWLADKAIYNACRHAADRYAARIIMVNHLDAVPTGKGKQYKPSGGRVWSKQADAELHLRPMRPATVKVRTSPSGIPEDEFVDRYIEFVKMRESRNKGMRIGFWLDPKSMRFIEKGPMVPRKGNN